MISPESVETQDNSPGTAAYKGYASRAYAEALCAGKPVEMPQSGGFLIVRSLPDSIAEAGYDLTSPYPFYSCSNWNRLADDVASLGSNYVTLSLVTDPFFDCDADYLRSVFADKCMRFKSHYIADMSMDPDKFISTHHRRNVRKSLKSLSIDILEQPSEVVDEWIGLYANLIERHQIQGVAQFSTESFRRQLRIPGMVASVARYRGKLVGMALWLLTERIAYYHLAAYSDQGYQLKASFSIFYETLMYLAAKVDYVSFGGGAGVTLESDDGLSRFKRGWASESRDVYFCGKIFDQEKYKSLCNGPKEKQEAFFPAYRT